MTSIEMTHPTTTAARYHPEWCDRQVCRAEDVGDWDTSSGLVTHRRVFYGDPATSGPSVEVWLSDEVHPDGRTLPFEGGILASAHVDSPLSIEQATEFGRALIDAAEFVTTTLPVPCWVRTA